jgi:murein DD-endopeptidase MepM/ murein hydrolase activator NlpD
MSTRRTAIRRTLGMTVVTTLVAAPAAIAAGASPVAGVAAVSATVSEAGSLSDASLAATSLRSAEGDTESAASDPAAEPTISDKILARDSRVSRSGTRVIPAVSQKPMPVSTPVVIKEEVRWVLPVAGYDLTGRFGSVSGLWSSSHTGLDFAAPSGTPIRSVADGVVTEAGYDGSYGYKTVVTLPDGSEVWYCHQDRLGVSKGQSLSAGEVLGYVGLTGNTTGSHLHLEVRQGKQPVDPESYLAAQGIAP